MVKGFWRGPKGQDGNEAASAAATYAEEKAAEAAASASSAAADAASAASDASDAHDSQVAAETAAGQANTFASNAAGSAATADGHADDALQSAQEASNAAYMALVGTGTGFDSVQQMLDSDIGYGANTLDDKTVNVAAGDRWFTKQGFAYDVVAAGASVYDLTTAGGVKLQAVRPMGQHAEFGALEDGEANDSAALSAYLGRSANRWGKTTSIGTRFNLPSGASLRDVKIAATATADQIGVVASAQDVAIDNVDLAVNAGSVGLQINAANITRFKLRNSTVVGTSYPVLFNSSANNLKGAWVTGNYLFSPTGGDGIEFNFPGAVAEDFIVGNNIFGDDPDGSSTSPNSGFAIGVARLRGYSITGNGVSMSRNEALHIEDGQQSGVVSGLFARDLEGDGVVVYGPSATQGEADPPMMSAISLRKRAANKGNGVAVNYPVNGGIPAYPTLGGGWQDAIFARGFDTYYLLSELACGRISGTMAECNRVASIQQFARVSGNVQVIGGMSVPAITAGQGAVFDGDIYSNDGTTSQKLISQSAGDGAAAAYRGKWTNRRTVAHGGTGTEYVDLMTCPDRVNGKILILYGDVTNSWSAEFTLSWDGTTLTQARVLSIVDGAIAAGNLRVQDGKIQVGIYCAAAIAARNFVFSFEGTALQRATVA